MRFFRFMGIAWRLSGSIPWVGEPEWDVSDANALRKFLVLREGKRFRMVLLNMVLKQNQQAVSATKRLEYEAGFASGVRTTVHTVEALAKDIEESKDFASDIYGDEYLASQVPTATDNRFSVMVGRG